MRVRRSLAILGGGAVAAQWTPALAAALPHTARAFGIPTTLAGAGGVLLTFDDGPHPEGTPAVLAALDRAGAAAVFFVCGEQVTRFPQLLREIAAAGHELGLHGYRHQTRRQWSAGLLADDTHRALEAVTAAVDAVPRLYRPPHGVFSLTGLRLVRGLALQPLLWSKWGRDWERRATPATIAANATVRLRPGDVVLLHDADHYGARGSWRATVAALPRIFDRLAAAGLEAASLSSDGARDGLTLTS